MRRTLLKFSSSSFLSSRHSISTSSTLKQNPTFFVLPPTSSPPFLLLKFFSSENDSPTPSPTTSIPDVDTKDFKRLINEYYDKGNDDAIPLIMEAILARKLSGKHDDSDNELIEELPPSPPPDDEDDTDKDFDSDG